MIFQVKTDCVFLDWPLKTANQLSFIILSRCYSQKWLIWKKLVFQRVALLLLDPASVDWTTFISAGGSLGLELNWKFGAPHQTKDEDCLFMHHDGKFGDYECDRDMYVLCDDGTD